MSSDAENRAGAILLPGQAIVGEEEEAPAIEQIASSLEAFSLSTKSSWGASLRSSFVSSDLPQMQVFDLPLAPMTYWVGQNITRDGFLLRVMYVTGFSETCDTAERVANSIDRFETPYITAEMDYSMGNLTIMLATLPIQQISIKYRVQLQGALL